MPLSGRCLPLLKAGKAKILIACLALTLVAGCAHVSPREEAETAVKKDPRLLAMLARYEENQGNWDRASQFYASIDDPFAWFALARISFIVNRPDNALDYIDLLIESGAFVDEALELRTKIYARKGDWHQAIEDTETLVERYPDNTQLKLFLANLRIIISDFTGAQEILRGLLVNGEDTMVLYTLSKACLGNKDLACAKDALRRVIELKPRFAPAYLELGRTHELLGESDEAESVYRQYLELEPDAMEALLVLSDLYISTNRYDDAIEQMEKLRRLSDDPQIIRKLALLQLQEGRYEDAIASIASIREAGIEDSYYLAIAYAKLDRLQEALAELSRITFTSRLGCEAALLRSSILKDLGRHDEVIDELSSAWDYFSPKGGCNEVGYQLATEFDAAGRREEGLEIALKLLESNPHDPVALNFVGYIWADEAANLDRAFEMISEALKQRPEDPYILDSMAWVLYRQNKPKEALAFLQKAVEKLDNDPTIHEHLGDVLLSLGKRDKALDHYLKASALSKNASDGLKEKINDLLD